MRTEEITPILKPSLCQAAASQLVVIDIQTKLGAVMPAEVLARVLEKAGVLLKAGTLLGIPVHVTEQYPRGLGPLEPSLAALLPSGARRFGKTCFSCADAEGFLPALHSAQRSQVFLIGMEAHVCVLQTAFDLRERGIQVRVVEDAICSRRQDNYRNAVARMQRAGIDLISAESVLFEWLRDARHEHFKAIAALLG
ncbi:MAG: isochorismatase family protein [Gammaproteobacteria bacterium]